MVGKKKQKELFGDLYNDKTEIPFINDKITPLFTGLFREYNDVIKSDKKNIIILGKNILMNFRTIRNFKNIHNSQKPRITSWNGLA